MPDLAVEVRTSRDLANLETDGVDIAMRFGYGDWPRLRVEPLVRRDRVPGLQSRVPGAQRFDG
ncbi:MAG: hypothetical protein WDM85_19210 [Caulobacteraceae bacterium]